MTKIASIQRVVVRSYSDTGQTMAHVEWTDTKGKAGATSGNPINSHMQALMARARHEGLTVTHETW